jgi:hypothetical protein
MAAIDLDQCKFPGTATKASPSKRGGLIMARPETAIPDEIYDIVSVLYHALQGAETYEQYIRDAEQRGDQELAQFFREVQDEEIRRALRGKDLLARRLVQ